MKEFLQILRRFVPPYKKYLGLSVLFNILSAVLNIFSFAALIPILQILFQVDGGIRANDYMEWDGTLGSIKEVATNNLYYYIQEFIVAHSASLALLVIGLFLAFMTFLKTGAYFLSSATIIPIRTGIVRDIRNQLYQKITSLSLGFFSEERKGDTANQTSIFILFANSLIFAISSSLAIVSLKPSKRTASALNAPWLMRASKEESTFSIATCSWEKFITTLLERICSYTSFASSRELLSTISL